MTARRKRLVFAAAALCVVLAGLAGCQYWYKDMKGYLEYWSSTVTVGNLTWRSTPDYQKNSSGMYTIPTNAVVSVTASIENPDNYPLDSGVGSAQDTLRSVRTAGTIGGTVRVTEATATSITAELTPFSFVPTPESRLLEHRDFTVTMVPTRTDSGLQAANPQELTLRYNTPPRMPVEVVENNGNLEFLGSTPWKMVQNATTNTGLNGSIYWAWPKDITDPTDPDYAARFQVYQDGVLVHNDAASKFLLSDTSLLSCATAVTDAGYNVYFASVDPGKVITIKAVDGEGVASQGTASDRAPYKITLNGSGGTFRNDKQTTDVYKAEGALVSGGDFETPQRAGSVLSGWAETAGGQPLSFPYKITGERTLHALWRTDWTEYFSNLGPGNHTVKITTPMTAADLYVLREAIAGSPDAKVHLDLSGATFDNNRLPESAFNGKNTAKGSLPNLVGVTLPDNLAGVGDYAFQNTGLTSVTIPGSMTTIAGSAFKDCTQLTTVTIEEGVKIIYGNVFLGCTALTTVKLPDSLTSIGDYAFQNTGLTSVTIPKNVQTIRTGAFHSCPQLTSVTIEDGVQTIEQSAFAYSGLTSVTIPGSVQSTGLDAFHNCAQLTSVTIQEGVKTIGQGSFIHCTALTSITIPRSVTSIESYALQDTGLTSVTIPGNVLTIGQDAFSGCAQLTSVTLQDGVQTIGQGAFHSCPALTSVTIPGSVETIGQDAFCVCPALTNVTIKDGVETIGQGAFHSCPALVSVTIPGSVQTIGQDAFKNCSALTSVTLEAGVKTIGYAAFEGTGLTSVTIPSGVETIEKYAFKGCPALTSVTIPSSVKTWGWDVFHSCTQLATVTMKSGLQSIGRGAFIHCTGLTSVTIPDGVTSIEPYAFERTGLTSITIPSSVQSIGQCAFLSSQLTTVNYRGSESDWNNLKDNIGGSNEVLTNATPIYNYTGP